VNSNPYEFLAGIMKFSLNGSTGNLVYGSSLSVTTGVMVIESSGRLTMMGALGCFFSKSSHYF
jgi:hypothetical protein